MVRAAAYDDGRAAAVADVVRADAYEPGRAAAATGAVAVVAEVVRAAA